jgi:hypothetical protein
MMSAARVLFVCLAVLVLAPAAGAKPAKVARPAQLHAFLLRADEPRDTSFSRTPAFAWNPVPGARKYQFQLATSASFRESAIVYSAKNLTTPVAAPTLTLPWIDDMMHARVRAITSSSVTPWSTIYNFDMDPPAAPTPLSSYPGLLRWTPVEGADAYEVWFVDIPKQETVFTNVLDEREFYTFHRTSQWTGTVRWRIRALRYDRTPSGRQNGLPATGYGPWSPVYSSTNPQYTGGPIQLVGTISDVVSPLNAPVAHRLMPGFAFTGDEALDGTSAELFRVYVYSDRTCLNRVFTSAVIGGPAYAPRPFGTMALPTQDTTGARSAYLSDLAAGTQTQLPPSVTVDGDAVVANESLDPATPTTAVPDDSDTDPGGDAGTPSSAPSQLAVGPDAVGAPVDLWDTQPSGGYWWTVVPVEAFSPGALSSSLALPAGVGATKIQLVDASGFAQGDVISIGDPLDLETTQISAVSGSTITLATALTHAHGIGEAVVRSGANLTYRDLDLPQDACASGRVARLAKTSEASLAAAGELFASGLSRNGKLIAATAKSAFYGNPLVAWTPALGATAYEVQWSKTRSPFTPQPDPQNGGAHGTMTLGTATVLPLTPGTWYYRVRGFNYSLPSNAQQMSWSNPAKIVVAKPQFKVVGG